MNMVYAHTVGFCAAVKKEMLRVHWLETNSKINEVNIKRLQKDIWSILLFICIRKKGIYTCICI